MTIAELTTSTETVVTAQDLWQMSGETKYELVEGELLEMTPPGGTHGRLASEIVWFLKNFIKQQNLGEVMVETGYRLSANPDTVRSPDVSFLAKARIPAAGLPEGYIDGPPDLAVEVVSPHDTAAEIQAKVQDYLAHGCQLVWVVYPQQQVVMVYHPDGTARALQSKDTLTGESVLPEFSCSIAEIFS